MKKTLVQHHHKPVRPSTEQPVSTPDTNQQIRSGSHPVHAERTHVDTNLMLVKQMDFGAALEYVRSNPVWLINMLTSSLYVMFIPVLGQLIYLGWCRDVYRQARTDVAPDSLRPFNISHHIRDGWNPFAAVSSLTMLWVIMTSALLGLGFQVLTAVSAPDLIMLGVYASVMAASTALYVFLLPDMMRRGCAGEGLPIFRPGPSIRAIRLQPLQYLWVVGGFLVTLLLGGLGFSLCGVGGLLTVPIALATSAHILAQWDSIVRQARQEPSA